MGKVLNIFAWFWIIIVYLSGLSTGFAREIGPAIGTVLFAWLVGYLVEDVEGVKNTFGNTSAEQVVPAVTAVCVILGLVASVIYNLF